LIGADQVKRHRAKQAPQPPDDGETTNFKVTWPDGVDGPDVADFSGVVGARAKLIVVAGGLPAIRFPAPFQDLVLAHREALTTAKALIVKQAIAYFLSDSEAARTPDHG
jgi:hypothetical protein